MTGIGAYVESKGVSVQTFYSRLKKAIKKGLPYTYPPKPPFAQYDDLLTPTLRKPYTLRDSYNPDRKWESICKRFEDANSREIQLVCYMSHFIPNLEDAIEELQYRKAKLDSLDPYLQFQIEQGLVTEEKRGRPLSRAFHSH